MYHLPPPTNGDRYCFKRQSWRLVPATGTLPLPRDRHVAVVFGDAFYVFGGFDGNALLHAPRHGKSDACEHRTEALC